MHGTMSRAVAGLIGFHDTSLRAVTSPDARPSRARAVAGFLVLGIGLRLVRYLQNYPMWCDETMLAVNLLDRRWMDLVQPLAYRQVCPLGFLALEWVVVQLVGFSELTLRLIPMLCAVASVPLFYLLARRLFGDQEGGLLLAIAWFAVAEPPVRYAAEIKPYATDLLIGLVLLNLAVLWRRAPERGRWLWALAAVAPLAVASSFPSVFLLGSIAMVGLWDIVKRPRTTPVVAYGAFLVATGLSVAAMAGMGQYRTSPADRSYFLKFWAEAFPPSWRDPLALGRWLARTHTGPLFAYIPGVRATWATALVFVAFVAGILSQFRRQPGRVAVLVLPFLLTFLAAALRRYPYGVSVRIAQFLAPATLSLAAAGVGWLVARPRRAAWNRWAIPGLAAALSAMGFWHAGQALGHPYRAPWDRTGREFARWFWSEVAADAELVCVRTDLGIPFQPGPWAYDAVDQYLCLQRIYSERHRRGQPPRWEAISPGRPLRCVLLNRMPGEVPSFQKWIESHRDRYQLREVRTYPVIRPDYLEPSQTYVVCEFVPTALAAGPTDRSAVRR
jgi:hypothetical protein